MYLKHNECHVTLIWHIVEDLSKTASGWMTFFLALSGLFTSCHLFWKPEQFWKLRTFFIISGKHYLISSCRAVKVGAEKFAQNRMVVVYFFPFSFVYLPPLCKFAHIMYWFVINLYGFFLWHWSWFSWWNTKWTIIHLEK